MSLAVATRAVVRERWAPMAGGVALILHHPEAAQTARPGQFFQIAVEAPHTLLRRPYSVASIDAEGGLLSFLFSVVGAGSDWLASLEPGHPLELLGPLGNGFDTSRRAAPVCIGGGLGIAPFPALVESLHGHGLQPLVLQGARSAARLLPSPWLRGAQVRVATDDGTAGWPGPVSGLLATVTQPDQEWFVCGPAPMLAAIMRLADRLAFARARIQVALEAPMGCGIGTCLGCAVPAAGGGYLLACQDGPCVRADRLDWERMTDAFHG